MDRPERPGGAPRPPVLDFHAHFPAGSRWPHRDPLTAAYAREREERMRREWDLPHREPMEDTPEGLTRAAAFWAAEVERHGLERVVFVTGRDNDTLASVVRLYPDRFAGMAHHPLTAPGAASELARAVEELGLVGYKILAPFVDLPFEDPSLDPVWEYCARTRLPVLIHFGLLGHAGGIVYHPRLNPLTLYPVAREYPEIPFVVPHFGCGYWQELLQLCWSCPNVYVDTSGSNQWVRWMPYPLSLEDLFRKAYETIGPRRLIFGSDSSWLPRGFAHRYLQDQLRVCYWLNFKDEDIAAIFAGNARRLLEGIRRP
ncbi:MAG: amidohydrolase family protein [Firmicutes bacterium]|nr:amidohydrolase family protein [Bacillota bacterium]